MKTLVPTPPTNGQGHLEIPRKRFDPDWHDALILIHPTWGDTSELKDYESRLRKAVDRALGSGRPVLHAPAGFAEMSKLERELIRRVPKTPSFIGSREVKSRVTRRRLQREVDEIAKIVGKPAGEIRLGFAGAYANACVMTYSQGWCRLVTPWWPEGQDAQLRRCLPKRPIAFGEVLEDLVIGWDDSPRVRDSAVGRA